MDTSRFSNAMQGLAWAWRRRALRARGVTVGEGCRIGAGVTVSPGVVLGREVVLGEGCALSGRIVLGDRVSVQKNAEIAGNVTVGEATVISAYSILSTMPSAHLNIGRRVLVNAFNILGAGERLDIGDDCIFAAHVQITDSTHSYRRASDSPRHGPASSSPVSLGREVWLGGGVKVLMGVTLGDGVVVGAGSVVNRSLPAMAIAVGSPARIVRTRTPDEPPTEEIR